MRVLWTAIIPLLLACQSWAAKQEVIETRTVELAPTASDAVLPISVWHDVEEPPQGLKHIETVVVGTGFFIDTEGDFITAAHVVDSLDAFKGQPNMSNARLTVTIRDRSGDGSAVRFTITDRDYDHDLVLCHVPGFRAVKLQKATIPKGANVDTGRPFASLAISTASPVTGRFILLSGFPLGSWTPTIQVGMVAATRTITPDTMYQAVIHKDGAELLQISVSGNHGNSGGPVIELQSGRVIGVIDQFVPALLQIGQLVYDANTFSASGIMLAAPAKWVEALLEKNHVKSEGVPAGKLAIQ